MHTETLDSLTQAVDTIGEHDRYGAALPGKTTDAGSASIGVSRNESSLRALRWLAGVAHVSQICTRHLNQTGQAVAISMEIILSNAKIYLRIRHSKLTALQFRQTPRSFDYYRFSRSFPEKGIRREHRSNSNLEVMGRAQYFQIGKPLECD